MKCAMIGLGMVSDTFADALSDMPDLTLKGVYARRPESRAAYLAKYPGPIDYDSIEAIADDPEIDFVILTTPPNARIEIVETLAQAGKHMLMEKPVERTLEAATRICEICEAASVKLGIVLQHRASPKARALREMISGGTLGKLYAVEINVPWWRPQSYYDEPGRGTYARDGGGVMLTQAIHPLDLMLSFTGPVSEVIAMTATSGFHTMESEDFVAAGLSFANGAIGSLFTTTATYPGRAERISFYFENASVELGRDRLHIEHQSGASETHGEDAGSGSGADPMAFSSGLHRAMIEDFAQCLSENRAPIVSGRDALEVHRLVEALTISGKTGQKFSL